MHDCTTYLSDFCGVQPWPALSTGGIGNTAGVGPALEGLLHSVDMDLAAPLGVPLGASLGAPSTSSTPARGRPSNMQTYEYTVETNTPVPPDSDFKEADRSDESIEMTPCGVYLVLCKFGFQHLYIIANKTNHLGPSLLLVLRMIVCARLQSHLCNPLTKLFRRETFHGNVIGE